MTYIFIHEILSEHELGTDFLIGKRVCGLTVDSFIIGEIVTDESQVTSLRKRMLASAYCLPEEYLAISVDDIRSVESLEKNIPQQETTSNLKYFYRLYEYCRTDLSFLRHHDVLMLPY